MYRFAVLLLTTMIAAPAVADEAPSRRLLMIGIDGCRPDALMKAETPHLNSLIQSGAWSSSTKIQSPHFRDSDTSSGPGWSTFLTGVWADKHGVMDNSFDGRRYDRFPHVFRRIRETYPGAVTGSFVDWGPIDQYIVEACDRRVVYPAEGVEEYTQHDLLLARQAAQYLTTEDPHAVMVYFGAVDETGHSFGFHPDNQAYLSAIETVDQRVGEVLSALRRRPQFSQEEWLIVVSTDHGGKDKGHGGGQDVPEINTTFLIVSGHGVTPGKVTSPTFLTDVVATGLTHLKIPLRPEWGLDGKAVGIPALPPAGGLSLKWNKRYLTISGKNIPGGPLQIHYLEAYCRPGSTDRDWKETVIPHESQQTAASSDGKKIELEDRLQDGVIVRHQITAHLDSVSFELTAHNPTQTPSQAHWAQPCLRVDGFTGTDPAQSRETYPPYIRKCFLMLDGRIQRLPTTPWALDARYIPGQVYAPAHVPRDDVNPRPLSPLVPSHSLTGCYSADESMMLGFAWEPYQEIFQGVITCMHNDFRIGGLEPGETKTICGRLYIMPANEEALLKRYFADFPTAAAGTPE